MGLAVLGFGADLVRTLVSMATKRSHIIYNEENVVWMITTLFLVESSSNLQVLRMAIKSQASLISSNKD